MNDYFLSVGSHATAASGRCAMEWVAYLAGEQHSDSPVCASPVLRRFCISFNDRLGDEDRQKLRPYLARCIGTAGDGQDAERLRVCQEHLVRRLPEMLDRAGCDEAARRIRALPEALTSEALRREMRFARDEAWGVRRKTWAALRAKYPAAAAAVADAAALAVAAADAVAVAAADADAAAVAAAVADAAAVAAAVADAAADAAADADAAAAADGHSSYDAAYKAAREAADRVYADRRAQAVKEGFALLERMLPTVPVQLPVVENAEAVCALV